MESGFFSTKAWRLAANSICYLTFSLRLSFGASALDENWDNRFFVLLDWGSIYSTISALALNDRGDVFVGGKFGGLGGISANNTAHWDGERWSALSGGVNGEVRNILVNGTDVYVGGSFTSAGSAAITNLARWDGTSWWPVGGGLLGQGVRTLALAGSNLYVGGTFTSAGGLPVSHIAMWDGRNWSDLAGGLTGSGSPGDSSFTSDRGANAIAFDGTNILVAGNFTSAGGIAASNICQWDGTNWIPIGKGLPSPAFAVTIDSVLGLWVGGGDAPPYIVHWDGSTWSYVPGIN